MTDQTALFERTGYNPATHSYASKERNVWFNDSGDARVFMGRVNALVCQLFELTPFHVIENRGVPFYAKQDNDDGSITFKYFNNEDRPVNGDGESYVYTIRKDGSVFCDTSEETMNLNDILHLTSIGATIIRDIYGDYNSEAVLMQWLQQAKN